VADQSSSGVVLLKGYAGTGKTSLVQSFRRQALQQQQQQPYFVGGKYDEHVASSPFSALADACSDLCHELLREQEDQDEITSRLNRYGNESSRFEPSFFHYTNCSSIYRFAPEIPCAGPSLQRAMSQVIWSYASRGQLAFYFGEHEMAHSIWTRLTTILKGMAMASFSALRSTFALPV